jgi:SAM-dependent methyltransferase
MASIVRKVPKLFRRLAGRGCSAADFDPVYARAEQDAWHYAENPFEEKRFGLILDALAGLTLGKGLEVGCAEGHLTERLAPRMRELVACDIVPEAVERTRIHCGGLPNVRVMCIDLRKRWPEEMFDLVVYSDVLNYFSRSEIKQIIRDSARHVGGGGHLLFANTWNARWRWSTPPGYVMGRMKQSPLWETIRQREHVDCDAGRSVTIGLFRRR